MPSRLVLQFLGLPQIHLDDKPISTDRRKAIALLAYLAVNDDGHPRQKYSRESLSALLWPDYDQAKAFSNLRTILWEIRQVIEEGWLIADRESVQLNPEAEIDLDVVHFQDLISQSRQQSDPSLRIPLLVESTKLYRDHFLTGFSLKDAPNFNDWAFAEAEELRRKLTDILTTLSEDHCLLGQAEQAIPYGRRLIALDPLNETGHRQLMNVYWQAGQHSAALKQYQACEQILRKELNIDPQPETRELYKKILRGETKPIRTEKQKEPILPKNKLPLQLSTFIGREKELNEIAKLIGKSRLVTLTGAGGIGKTRLSLEAARKNLGDFPDGVWFVELAPLSDPAFVPQAVVNTLGLIEQSGRLPVSILTDFLRAKRALLILDNCEHLIQACTQLVETLLHNCPDLHILVTSREVLGITGETVYLVPPLMIPDSAPVALESLSGYEAVQLFMERAQSALAGFTLTRDNAPAIAQICHQLDGIPLALELAAARLKVLKVEEIAARLDDRFQLLTGGARTALPRHQTLQALIDWSYELLTEQERILLRRLSVFTDGWTLEAAEAVCADQAIGTDEILNLLTELLNKSIVIAKHGLGSEIRYQMLETIREYAHDKLWAASEAERLRQHHLAYFVDLAERAEPHLRAYGMVMWLDRLESEHDNIRSALEWALENDIEAELRLASALLWFWHIRGHKNEGIGWLERALSIEAMDRNDQLMMPSRAMIRGKALNASGSLMVMNHEYARAPARLEESLTLFKELGPTGKRGMAYALLRFGGSLPTGDVRSGSMLEQSLALFRELKDKFGIAECLMLLAGQVASIVEQDDDYSQAILFTEEQLALRREIGDQDGAAVALTMLGDLALSQENYQKATLLYEEALAGLRAVGNSGAVSLSMIGFGDIFFWSGDYERAAQIYEAALSLAQDIGYKFIIALDMYSLGIIAWFQGDYARAAQLIGESQPTFRVVGNHWLIASSLHALGDIALAEGDEAGAAQWYVHELALNREAQLEFARIYALEGLGKVAWARGDTILATKHFEEGLKISREADIKPTMFRALYHLGRTAQARGDIAAARAFYVEALELQRRRVRLLFRWTWLKTYQSAAVYPLAAIALLAAVQNNMPRAARLLGAAETLYTPLRFEMSAKERAEHDRAIASARAELGEEAFAMAWEKGKKMTMEQAIEYALEENHA